MLPAGTIVTVIDQETSFSDFQGTVVRNPGPAKGDYNIAVQMGPECSHLCGIESDRIVLFRPQDLRAEHDWSFETKVKRFGRSTVMRSAKLKYAFGPNSMCMHEKCVPRKVKATGRIAVNVLGTVIEYEACDQHKNFDGKLIEDVPFLLPQPV